MRELEKKHHKRKSKDNTESPSSCNVNQKSCCGEKDLWVDSAIHASIVYDAFDVGVEYEIEPL